MTEPKLTPEQLMDALEAIAKANGYCIKRITFAPRSQPSNSSVSHQFETNHIMMDNYATGYKVMVSDTKFTTTKE